MSDDLVQRMRKRAYKSLDFSGQIAPLLGEAADHIERLQADIRGMTKLAYARGERVEALRGALREIAELQDLPADGVGITLALKRIQIIQEIARRALEGSC